MALTEGAGRKVIRTVSFAAIQGPVPSGSLVVNIRFKVPLLISAAVGMYVAVSEEALGEKVPAPPDQVPEVALPEMEPERLTPPVPQALMLAPALATGGLEQVLQLMTVIVDVSEPVQPAVEVKL